MDDRRLRAFLAIVDNKTLTEAARVLHVAQPSLSQTLQVLERELGTHLFHRIGRRLTLTPAGEALIGPARRALQSLEATVDAVNETTTLRTGTVEIAALSTLANDPLAELIGRFRQAHGSVTVRVREAETLLAVGTLVRSGACELGLTRLPTGRRDYIAIPLGSQEMYFVLPPGAAKRRHPIRTSELASLALVVAPPGTSTRTLLEEALAKHNVQPRIAVETGAREATIPLVLAGAGAALLPAPLAREAERRGAVLRQPQPPITRRIGLIHRKGPLTPATIAFLEQARLSRLSKAR
jgi:DNA-binding transcriptional LysR family regulator